MEEKQKEEEKEDEDKEEDEEKEDVEEEQQSQSDSEKKSKKGERFNIADRCTLDIIYKRLIVHLEDKKVTEKEDKPLKSILKNKDEKPAIKKTKKTKLSKESVKTTIDNQNISNLEFADDKWIKENLLEEGSEFRGWKKTINHLIKSAEGKDTIKKKFKKVLRKTYELSASFAKEPRKELNTTIEKKLIESKKVKVFSDLVQNTQTKKDEVKE